MSSKVLLGARLATVPDLRDPNSTHQTFGNGFQAFPVALDRVFVRWTPVSRTPLAVYAGKFGHVFTEPVVFGELVWDADVQPEGLAVVFGPHHGIRLAGAEYIVLHRSPGKTVGLTSVQATWTRSTGVVAWSVAGGLQAYQEPDLGGAAVFARQNQGNALRLGASGDTTGFASKFVVLHGFGSLQYSGWKLPVRLEGQYAANPSAAAGLDQTGFAVGAQAGNLDRVGGWRVYYQYQHLGQESVFSPVAQDDFLDATNMRGHLAGIVVQVMRRANAHFWWLWSARQVPRSNGFQKRLRLDLNLAF